MSGVCKERKDIMPERREEQSVLDEIVSGLPGHKVQLLTQELRAIASRAAREAVEETLPAALDHYREERLGYSDEVAGLVRLLAGKTNDSKENVLSKALTLYGLAVDAHENGNRLSILNPEDEIVQDIVGFDDDRSVTATPSAMMAGQAS